MAIIDKIRVLLHLFCETSAGQLGPTFMPWQSRFHWSWERRGVRRSSREDGRPTGKPRVGFTLIELLVVIAIIGILVALVVNGLSRVPVKVAKAVAVAERTEVESAIQEYRDKLGFYPPDNPSDPAMNPLWFELSGTTNNGVNYVTLDGSGQISVTEINEKFNRQGFANSGTKAHSTDESAAPIFFLSSLKAKQVGLPAPVQPFI